MPISIASSPSISSKDKFAAIRAKTSAIGATKKKGRSGHAKPREPRIPLSIDGFWGTGEILAVTGWSAAKLFSKIKAQTFPAPQRDGNRNIWKTSVLREVLDL